MPLTEAPHAYRMFNEKKEGCVKVRYLLHSIRGLPHLTTNFVVGLLLSTLLVLRGARAAHAHKAATNHRQQYSVVRCCTARKEKPAQHNILTSVLGQKCSADARCLQSFVSRGRWSCTPGREANVTIPPEQPSAPFWCCLQNAHATRAQSRPGPQQEGWGWNLEAAEGVGVFIGCLYVAVYQTLGRHEYGVSRDAPRVL